MPNEHIPTEKNAIGNTVTADPTNASHIGEPKYGYKAGQGNPPVALITGAAKRIGATMARTLHSAGYRVIVHYGHSAEHANALVNALNAIRPNSAACLQADLCKLDDITRLAQQATAPNVFDVDTEQPAREDCSDNSATGINVLINNASSFYPTPLGNISASDWQALVGSNVQGPLFLSQALWPALKANNGCIINMVDMHIDRPLPHHTVYGLAKTALASITRSLAVEMAPEVRVNGIAPGAILWPERELELDQKQRLLDSIPLGGLGSPEDIANTATFLISANYITGQIIYVDGGRSLHTNASA